MTFYRLLGFHALLWSLIPTFLFYSPPLDVVELVTLYDTGAVANYKHPNLPGLILQLLAPLGIDSLYWVSQLCVATTLVIVYWFAYELVDAHRALASSLLLFGVFYFILPTPEFNHNVLQMPFWAAIISLTWTVSNRPSWGFWLALGVTSGLLLWVKYTGGILLLCVAIWLLFSKGWKERIRDPRLYVGAIVAIVIALPQLNYLIQTNGLPLEYASARAGQADEGAAAFLLTQLINHFPMLLLMGFAGLLGRNMLHKQSVERAHLYVIWMLFGPLLILVLTSSVLGSGLRDMWGAPMFSLSGLAVMMFFGRRLNEVRLIRLHWVTLIFSVALAVLYGWQFVERDQRTAKPSRMHWPQAEIAAQAADYFGDNIPLVVGPYWVAGLVAMQPDGWCPVMVDGDPIKSPWVLPEDLDQGFLVVYDVPTDSLSEFMERNSIDPEQGRRFAFSWSPEPDARIIELTMIAVGPNQ